MCGCFPFHQWLTKRSHLRLDLCVSAGIPLLSTDRDAFLKVIWEYSGSSEDHCPRFFIDLYSCKENTTSSGADCGEFARELCSEEGCLSHHGAAWVYLPLVRAREA